MHTHIVVNEIDACSLTCGPEIGAGEAHLHVRPRLVRRLAAVACFYWCGGWWWWWWCVVGDRPVEARLAPLVHPPSDLSACGCATSCRPCPRRGHPHRLHQSWRGGGRRRGRRQWRVAEGRSLGGGCWWLPAFSTCSSAGRLDSLVWGGLLACACCVMLVMDGRR